MAALGGRGGGTLQYPPFQLRAATGTFHICHLEETSQQSFIEGINSYCPIWWMRKLRLRRVNRFSHHHRVRQTGFASCLCLSISLGGSRFLSGTKPKSRRLN